MRRLCDNGDGRKVHARGLCNPCYHRAMYRPSEHLPPTHAGSGMFSYPGIAMNRNSYKGVLCCNLPAVWAAEDAQRAAATAVARVSA